MYEDTYVPKVPRIFFPVPDAKLTYRPLQNSSVVT